LGFQPNPPHLIADRFIISLLLFVDTPTVDVAMLVMRIYSNWLSVRAFPRLL
jgi:hypothetical protein